jgi:hypothetical protein
MIASGCFSWLIERENRFVVTPIHLPSGQATRFSCSVQSQANTRHLSLIKWQPRLQPAAGRRPAVLLSAAASSGPQQQ